MAFSEASIKYRPLRIGFLVREGQIADVVKAAGINTLLWGGIHNPVIPIRPDDENELAKQLLELFNVDLLYPVEVTEEITAFQGKYPYLRDPGHYAENIFYGDSAGEKKKPGVLDIKNLIDLWWDKEYRNKPEDYRSNLELLRWSPQDTLANIFSIEFGYFPDLNTKTNYEKAFLNGLRAREKEIALGANLDIEEDRWSPIELTDGELRGFGGGPRFRGDGVYAGDSTSFSDYIQFWNLRAAGINLNFLPINELERARPYIQKYIDRLNKRPRKQGGLGEHISCYGTQSPERLKEITDEFTSERPFAINPVSEHTWNGLNIYPYTYVFKRQSASLQIEKTPDRYNVQLKLPPMNFLVDSDDFDLHFQQLSVVISPYSSEYAHPGYTFKLPYLRELNEFYSRSLSFEPWSFRIEREGFSKVIQANENSLSLYPVSKEDLIEEVLKAAGISSKTSQPGLIAKKLIEKMEGLEAARVFKIKGVRMILEEGGPSNSLTRGEATKVIHENAFEKHKRLYIESREATELTSSAVFDYLLKKTYFRAGLELYCKDCNLSNWLPLKAIDDIWTCEYCGGVNQTSPHLNHRGDWKFRKSGLFAKDNHQEGAIPVLLTLLTLKRVLDHSDLLYTTALNLTGDGVNCESDFVVLHEKRKEVLEIAIGEAKSEGGEINEEDIGKLQAAAEKIKGLNKNVQVYIVFSKTADNFRPAEIELFKELSKKFPIVLFTNRELELYHPYWDEKDEEEKDVPDKHPQSLSNLATNSHARYLKEDKKKPHDLHPKTEVL